MKPKRYVIKKDGVFWPSEEMKKIAWVKSKKIYQDAEKNPIKFWEKLAYEGISWNKKWKKAYEEKLPYFKWFIEGKLNFCYNCLDRHLDEKSNKTALIWIPEPLGEKKIKLSYKELFEKVNKFSNVLKKHGIKKGDVVAIYLPLIPEIFISMLACTRIGAIHSVVFSAFSADALKARIEDGEAKLLISADGYYRRGEKENLLEKVKEAIKDTTIKKTIIVRRLGESISDPFLDFEEEIKKVPSYCEPEIMDSEDIMFILYTSGTTGKPKGIVHDTGGYSVQSYWTSKWNFNLKDDDVMWCTADIGWITGHTYAVYGPLLNGSTTLIYEGAPDYPNPERWWKIIEENNVSVFYTAPTAIRMFIKFGDSYIDKYNLDSLKILGSVGEPINKDAWMWYFNKVGKKRCPIIDTWWQTETGGTLINSLPGIGPFIPSVAGKSFPGTRHEVVDENGKKLKIGKNGFLVQLSPFAPGMLRGVYKNHEKYVKTYWERFKDKYDTSDGAILIKKDLIKITGRTDDMMKVAGHRLSTAELEGAIEENEKVIECAVVPMQDQIKGQSPVAFVVLKPKVKISDELEKEIKKQVDKKIGPIARPSKVYFVEDLPKTRSGKIMRRILKNILDNEEPQGIMTLLNSEVVEKIKEQVKKDSLNIKN